MQYDRAIAITLFLLVGTTFLVVGLPLLAETLQFFRSAAKTQGRVIGYLEQETGDSRMSHVWHMQVEFEDQQGKRQTVTLGVGSDRKRYKEGFCVPILFDPTCPSDAKIDSFLHFWRFPLTFTVGGVFGIGMAFVIWLRPEILR
jgi:Protein of unknown function (DUF3592)